MSRRIAMPLDKFTGAKWESLTPEARRLYATSWVVASREGFVSREQVQSIQPRWADRFYDDDGTDIADIVTDLERLGFICKVIRKADRYVVTPSGAWLS